MAERTKSACLVDFTLVLLAASLRADLLGSLTGLGGGLGIKVLLKAATRHLRLLFAVVMFVLGLEMIYHGLTGRI